jgi:cob(I)alamin adenosyltransferase
MAGRNSLVIVHTGDGKGKTTAALGLGLRAAGHGRKVLVLQFIKGPQKSGEHESVKKLEPLVEIRRAGKGFVDLKKGPGEEDIAAAREGLKQAADALNSGDYGLVVLDEILYAVGYGLLSAGEVIEAVRSRRPDVDVVLTGRNAPAQIVEMADTVTEFREVKHPFRKGIKARKGIEF